ncbi:uncharacterized protein LOC124687169 [Lolium rigidum]|uniref:uncharacterized protein LOC124687169 n=1 Tax=Lolium rigidum TaxID=89674 RepID=UPI001F5DAAF0|nr:uncharacterized protein LOC124687169 [Lolium rigidum]
MDLPPRRPEPAAIDITWLSCRGVRSSLPFHTPCLYASVCVTSYAGKSARGRRLHRVKTPTDRVGGENPEWDERLRLHLTDDAASSPASDSGQESPGNNKDGCADDDVLVVRFDLKAEVAVLGDVLAASAVVPLAGLVADGRTHRVSYQLAASSDGRQPNGVISFSYAFHDRSNQEEEDHRSDGEPVTPPSPVSLAPASPGMYPAIDWPSIEQLTVYPPLMEKIAIYPPLAAETVTATRSSHCYYASAPPPETPVRSAAIYPAPLTREISARGIYPAVGEPDNGLYPTVDLAPVSCYPPMATPCYGGGFGYPAVPDWDTRCLYS